jgi:hypothetical protein
MSSAELAWACAGLGWGWPGLTWAWTNMGLPRPDLPGRVLASACIGLVLGFGWRLPRLLCCLVYGLSSQCDNLVMGWLAQVMVWSWSGVVMGWLGHFMCKCTCAWAEPGMS